MGGTHPINEILLWHNAIKRELNEMAEEARKIQLSGDFIDLSVFNERLQFIAEEIDDWIAAIIKYCRGQGAASTSAAEFYSKLCQHADQIMETILTHFHNEEVQVLPIARKSFSFKRQRELLYQSLCVMPLRLIERVLPWLVGSLTDNEAWTFLKNMLLAAPATDTALMTLFSGWACKGRNQGMFLSPNGNGCGVKGLTDIEEDFVQSCCACSSSLFMNETCSSIHGDEVKRPVKRNVSDSCKTGDASDRSVSVNAHEQSRNGKSCCVPGLGVNTSNLGLSSLLAAKSPRSLSFSSSVPSLNSSPFFWETDNNLSNIGLAERPIDTIFKFHKAIRKDLEYLDVESGKLSNGDETFLRQFIGRFHLLWGLKRAHSNAEDDIVFPALESKETLQNVSHSHTLDRKQEEKLFVDINNVLSELSHLHESFSRGHVATDTSIELSGACDGDCLRKYNELATKLQGMCKSIRVTLDHHIFREELELWPLFGKHFSVEEQDKLVGRIIGTTGAEVLQSMLSWVTSALTQEEKNKMMDTLRQATKNTMFNEWLNECWKKPSESPLQNEMSETDISLKDNDFQDSLEQCGQMFKPGWKDIFRMNQNELESEIRKVYRDSTLDPRRKAYLVQNLITSRWIAAQQKFPQAAFNGEDVLGCSPSFRDPEKQIFGFCHDNVSDHSMDRKATLEMMCMRCLKIQPVGSICATPSCNGLSMAKYYSSICKFFDDESALPCGHCMHSACFQVYFALQAVEELPEEYRDRCQACLFLTQDDKHFRICRTGYTLQGLRPKGHKSIPLVE
ncbi:hypothetical protein GQ457_04G039080 [Hibiscus cannabinus]